MISEEIKQIYESYGYEYKCIQNVDVFEYKHGRYFGADIFDDGYDVESVKAMYQKQNFAVSIKKSLNEEAVENELFDSFFQTKMFQNRIKREYSLFAKAQTVNFDDAHYEYVNGCYSAFSLDSECVAFDVEDNVKRNVVEKVISSLNLPGANLVIIEAAAGFGKTCTANEIVFKMCENDENTLPLHIELSKNREARVFKHILQNEIENQFQNAVTSRTVARQIERGKIPVIIDGFDELLSKDCNNLAEKSRDAESMLNTIISLLKKNAKIIITSRKTAIFNDQKFYSWISNSSSNFSTHRISIAEPNVNDWLDAKKINLLQQNGFPLQSVANPVLLSYLKYSTYDNLVCDLSKSNNIVDNYFSFLLEREKERQKIKWEKGDQLRILEKLVRVMCEGDFKSDDKTFIKDIILDTNKEVFRDYISAYRDYPKPTQDELAETLSNHALLDRKKDNTVGFINDFVFGFLIGKNFIEGKFEKHYPEKYGSVVSQDFALLALSAFRFQPLEEKQKIYEILKRDDFNYNNEFIFFRDLFLKNDFENDQFNGLTIKNIFISNVSFKTLDNQERFSDMVFESCVFEKCQFERGAFGGTALLNCSYQDCEWIDGAANENRLCISGFKCNNDFVNNQYANLDNNEEENNARKNYEQQILELFIRSEKKIKLMRKIEDIYDVFERGEKKNIDKTINQLRTNQYIAIDGNRCFIQKEGIIYYNKNYRGLK